MIARRRREIFCHLSALKCIFLNKNEGFPNDFESKSQNFRPSAEIMTFYENAPPLVAGPPSNKGGGTFIRIALIPIDPNRSEIRAFLARAQTWAESCQICQSLEKKTCEEYSLGNQTNHSASESALPKWSRNHLFPFSCPVEILKPNSVILWWAPEGPG